MNTEPNRSGKSTLAATLGLLAVMKYAPKAGGPVYRERRRPFEASSIPPAATSYKKVDGQWVEIRRV